jgi:cell shape-determining protein MreC
MSYAPRNNTGTYFQSSRARQGVSTPIKVALIFAVILALFYAFLPRVLPGIFLGIISPLWKADRDAKLGATNMEELRSAYASMVSNRERENALQNENAELKSLMERTSLSKPLLATVLKKPPFSAYDSFILDVGESGGVKMGQTVYALGDIPIGRIGEVFAGTSRVLLYSSAGEQFDVLIGPSNIETQAVGKGGGHFEVSLPRDTKIVPGDKVHIPSLGNSFVGTVEGLASEPSEPFAKILFRQPFNLYEQRWVIIDTHEN